MKWRRILVGFAIMVLVVVLAVLRKVLFVWAFIGLANGLSGADETHLGTCVMENPDNAIESIAEFKLPLRAKLLESSCMGLQGWYANAKFEMDAEELDTFVNSTKVSMPLANKGVAARCGYPLDDSTPQLFGEFQATEFYQAIFIDISNPARYIVYVCVLGG